MRLSRDDVETRDVSPRPLARILVGVDFSESSLAMAQWVGRHLADTAVVTLVHVIAMPATPNVSRFGSSGVVPAEGTLRARVRSFTGALRGLAGLIGQRTDVDVRVGDPAVELCTYAEALDADLIVIGGNPVFPGAPRVDARTTERIVRDLTRPVLIARNLQAAPTTVLAALTDDGRQSAVLTTAHMVAERSGARVSALRLSAGEATRPTPQSDTTLRVTGRVAEAHHAVGKREQVRMILDVARELRAELIVVGRSVFDDVDDVARMLARTANSSVLIVPCPAEPYPRRPSRVESMWASRRWHAPGRQSGGNDDSEPPRPAATLPGTGDAA